MKKIVSFLIVFSIILSIFSAGQIAFAEKSDSPIWEKRFYLDQFNDPTDEYYLINNTRFSGTYNNDTVTNGNLEAEIVMDMWKFYIVLYKNGSEQIKNGTTSNTNYNISVKKSDGTVVPATGTMYANEDRITVDESCWDTIREALYSSADSVVFYIEQDGKSINNYVFRTICDNFVDLCDAEIILPLCEIVYQGALALAAEKKYDEAIPMFQSLGTYKDSAEQVQAMIDEINAALEEKYQAAEALVAEGNLGLAAISFWNIGEYRDARQRSLDLWAQVTERKTIAAGGWHTVAVKEDGTVVARGSGDSGQKRVTNWTDIIAVDSCLWNTVGLKEDGTVVAVGENDYGQCSVSGWKDIVAVASGEYGTLGLKANGTVILATSSRTGVSKDIAKWPGNIVSISGGRFFVGLKEDGTVISTDAGYMGMDTKVADWSDIVAIASGGGVRDGHIVGLKADGTVLAVGENEDGQCNVSEWTDIVAIAAGLAHTVGLKSDGTVVAVGYNREGQCNVSDWKNIVAISAGSQHTIGLKADGTMVAVGYSGDGDGQCNVSDWTGIKLPQG